MTDWIMLLLSVAAFVLGGMLYFVLKDPVADMVRNRNGTPPDYFEILEAQRLDEIKRYQQIIASETVTSGMLAILRAVMNGMDLWSPPGGPWRLIGPENPDSFLASRERRDFIDVDQAEVEALKTLGYLKELEAPCSRRYDVTDKGREKGGGAE